MKIGIPKEMHSGERRVAASPETVKDMLKSGLEVMVETQAGMYAHFSDQDYKNAGAKIETSFKTLLNQSDIILKVQHPIFDTYTGLHEIHFMKDQSILIGLLSPLNFPEILDILNDKKITSFSLDLLPGISETQSFNALMSMSKIAGYKSIIIAAYYLGKIFYPLTITKEFTSPVKVLVLGAGAAGIQAIATAKKLGADVIAMDNRLEVSERVIELDAKFVSLSKLTTEQQQDIIFDYLKEVDVVISSAKIPGQRAPILITEAMLNTMKPGSVIVDLAIEQKGNCELTEAGKLVVKNNVTIIGFLNIPSTMPIYSSELYAQNIWAFLKYLMHHDEKLSVNREDEIIKSCLVTYDGKTVHPRVKELTDSP